MKRHNLKSIFAIFTAIFFAVLFFAQICSALPAFPGAEGFGSETIGGRGGQVYEVTNLNDSGPGSLRAAIEASDPRIVIFKTGGTITLNSSLIINNPFITIAGQTAPGGGITLKNGSIQVKTHDVIIRYITVRRGPGGADWAILIAHYNSTDNYKVIVDHCSLSWATDETITSWYRAYDITMSWNMISEALDCSTHPKGCHSKGSILGGPHLDNEPGTDTGAYNITAHHNLWAHTGERQPLIKTSGLVDVVNNVSYNPKWQFSYFDMQGDFEGQTTMKINYIGNYYKHGPDSGSGYEIGCADHTGITAEVYVYGNIGPHRTSDGQAQNLVVDSSMGGLNCRDYLVESAHPVSMPVISTSATQAYSDVLAIGKVGNSKYIDCAGNWVNRRDSIDNRVINEVKNGTGFIIDNPNEVGGWLNIETGTACLDSDHDGMPDVWETNYSFNPNSSSDNTQDPDGDGYTNIEEYINGTNPKYGVIANTPPEPPEEFKFRPL